MEIKFWILIGYRYLLFIIPDMDWKLFQAAEGLWERPMSSSGHHTADMMKYVLKNINIKSS